MSEPKHESTEKYEDIIQEIIRILRLDGEEFTDGECLDLIIKHLGANGWKVFS